MRGPRQGAPARRMAERDHLRDGDTRHAVRALAVRIEGTRLRGQLWGEPVDVARHAPACEPKGATYTALRVHEEPDGTWSAACVVDV